MPVILVAALVAALAAPIAVATTAARPDAGPVHAAAARSDASPRTSLYPLPARSAKPKPCIINRRHHRRHGVPGHRAPRMPAVSTAHLPAALDTAARHADLAPVRGKGMWWTTWPGSRVDAAQVVSRARAAGLHQLWVRTGGSTRGWYGAPLLSSLLPAAHAAGIAVVAWDFPTLSDPLADVARARRAIAGTFRGQHIDAFSPDIETGAEGTYNSPVRVRVYLSRVRAVAGRMPVVATVMNPTPRQRAHYPYAAEARYVDAFAPMVYWGCAEPGGATARAIAALAHLRPVVPIGQAYNMAAEGGRIGLPTAAEIWRFLDVSKRHGALGASLYDAETASRAEWKALGAYPWRRTN